MKVKNIDLDPKRVKAGPEDGLKDGEFIVYPSTFTRTPDAYGDVVAKGAFLDDIEAWKTNGNVLPGLYGHRLDDPDFFVAGAIEEGEDEHGWWVKGEFDLESPKGAHVYRLVKGRRLNQLSFAYDVLDEGKVELENGETANELRKLKRYEFSFVPIGANQDTSVVAVKSAVDAMVADVKAGRVISAKNEKALRAAHESLVGAADEIKNILSAIDGDEGKGAPASDEDQNEASGTSEAKSGASDEEPTGAKSSVSDEEPKASPSVRLATELSLLALASSE